MVTSPPVRGAGTPSNSAISVSVGIYPEVLAAGRARATLAAGASAVLCVAVCVLWLRGRWCQDHLSAGIAGRTYQVSSGGGRFIVARSRPGRRLPIWPEAVRWSVERPPVHWDDAYGSPW